MFLSPAKHTVAVCGLWLSGDLIESHTDAENHFLVAHQQ